MARILLIDDDELIRITLSRSLTDAGHLVTLAGDGAEGLDKFARAPFDLVITDIIMPEREGIETIIKLRQHKERIAVIAISGGGRQGNLDFLKAAREFGADSTLSKPFTGPELLAAVDAALSKPAAT